MLLLEQKFNAASFFGVIRFSLFPILPENMKNICQSQASVYDLAPLNFRRRVTRPVSYYAPVSYTHLCWARTNDPAVNSRMLYRLS